MLFITNPNICLPGEPLLFIIVEGASKIGLSSTDHVSHIFWAKEMAKQYHVSIPSIPGTQCRLDVNKTRMFATNVGHDVPNLAPVIHKGSSRGRHPGGHLLIHRVLPIRRVFII
jgi:hypothetical protein